jgi:hypothetical protein
MSFLCVTLLYELYHKSGAHYSIVGFSKYLNNPAPNIYYLPGTGRYVHLYYMATLFPHKAEWAPQQPITESLARQPFA